MTGVRRLFFGAATVVLWAIVAAAALETFGWYKDWRLASSNPYVLLTLGKLPPQPSKPSAQSRVPLAETEAIAWAALLPAASSKVYALPMECLPAKDMSEAARQERWGGCGEWDERARQVVATVNREFVLLYGKHSELEKCYGSHFLEGLVRNGRFGFGATLVREGPRCARKVLDSGQSVSVTLDVDVSGFGMRILEGCFFRLGDGGPDAGKVVAVFRVVQSGAVRDGDWYHCEEVKEDSRWAIPFFRYKPNLRGLEYGGHGTTFETDAQGFRDRAPVIPKPSGTFRVLCVGASTTEEGPANDATYPRLLEAHLRGFFPGRPIEVFNWGIAGTYALDHAYWLQEVLEAQPDLLMFYEGGNELSILLPSVWRQPLWRALLSSSKFCQQVCPTLVFPGRADMEDDIAGTVFQPLDALCVAARRHGIRVALCSIAHPNPATLDPAELGYFDYTAHTRGTNPCLSMTLLSEMTDMLNAQTRDYCHRENLLYIPVAENLSGGCGTYCDSCHMTPEAIKVKAAIIAEYLKAYIAPAITNESK
jgi:hypothetical protein